MSYKLSAQVQIGDIRSRLTESKFLSQIPFEDIDAAEKFEPSLIFSMNPDQITELDLQYEQSEPEYQVNPFLDAHLFIIDYKPTDRSGDSLIKSWKLRDTYPCEFFSVNDRGTKYFKVVVTHFANSAYLKLHKLPEDIKYMAYYFNEVLQVAFDSSQKLQYIYLKMLSNKYEFKKQMKDLEIKYNLVGNSQGKISTVQAKRPQTAHVVDQ